MHLSVKPCRLLCLLLLLFNFSTNSAGADQTVLKKASLIPLWYPQAQFAGYYVALEKGIYRNHGIDLKILPGGPDHSPTQLLRSGEADFAVLWLSTALQQYESGEKLINVAQIVQKSSMMLVARKSSGIDTPADMQGKKVGIWGGGLAIPAETFFKKYQLSVREVRQSYTVNLFLRGGIDVASAMWYNEFHTILNSGIDTDELNLFFLHDYGIKFPEDGLYTLAKTYRRDPILVDAFVKASLAGWAYAFANPEETLDIVIRLMNEANLPANRAHQQWMLARMRDLIQPLNSSDSIGELKLSDYEAVGSALQINGVIKTVPGFEDFVRRSDAR
ncbi:MAG: ABC transporter substrate-binding protein [Deltaproteobacteria bacterium RIFOXYD12_FULL_50_9]|nr:MAG: ABC transporter substrate-binding protein [Deltaproteobacteria bacterium RIFOXYD12_FULL_50_9]